MSKFLKSCKSTWAAWKSSPADFAEPYQGFPEETLPQGGFIPPEEVQCHLGPPGGLPSGAEQNQLKDGSVKIPEVLQKYMGGMEVLTKK